MLRSFVRFVIIFSPEDLNRIFSVYGSIVDIYIPRDRHNGGNRGFGFVRYSYNDEAQKALGEDGKDINGRVMTVKMADARPEREYSSSYLQ